MKKNVFLITTAAIILSIFAGCQANPEKNAVISKNDGIFEEKIDQTLSASQSEQTECQDMIQWSDAFTSTDGSVSFIIDITQGITKDAKQVIEVTPHALTGEDLERIAKALLGDVSFYERRSSQDPEYSKSQYQQMIGRLAPYTNRDSLVALMGGDTYLEYIQAYIAFWTQKLETAPEADPRTLCDWTLKKERHYNNSESETEGRLPEEDADVLLANAEKDGMEYIFSVISKNSGAYKVNRLNLNLTEGLGLYPVELAIYRSMVCRTEEPTQEQIEAASAKAMHMLEQMELGQWYIYSTNAVSKTIGNAVEHTIEIIAAPAFYGDPVLLGQHLGPSKEDYAPSYPATYAEFTFSANGDLIYFNLDSPLDIVQTRNERVATLSTAELMEQCKQNLSYSDAGSFGLPADTVKMLEETNDERIRCHIQISEAAYGLGRVAVAGSDDHYYYIPVLVLGGTAEYLGETSGRCYFSGSYEVSDKTSALIWVNAVDGSVIN